MQLRCCCLRHVAFSGVIVNAAAAAVLLSEARIDGHTSMARQRHCRACVTETPLHPRSQEPEGHGAPKTPGHWKTMWATDCARLEEAHHRGDAEVLVYGRKYVVDMKVGGSAIFVHFSKLGSNCTAESGVLLFVCRLLPVPRTGP